jgi:hypothetical protein
MKTAVRKPASHVISSEQNALAKFLAGYCESGKATFVAGSGQTPSRSPVIPAMHGVQHGVPSASPYATRRWLSSVPLIHDSERIAGSLDYSSGFQRLWPESTHRVLRCLETSYTGQRFTTVVLHGDKHVLLPSYYEVDIAVALCRSQCRLDVELVLAHLRYELLAIFLPKRSRFLRAHLMLVLEAVRRRQNTVQHDLIDQ